MGDSVKILQSQLADITADVKALSTSLSENERQELLETSRSLVRQIESPKEKIVRMMWHEPLVLTAVRLLIDLNVFKTLVAADETRTAAQLASSSGAEQSLMARLLKHVAVEQYVTESAADTYIANDNTRTLATAEAEGCVLDMFQTLRLYARLPDFLRETQYVNPRNKDASPWTYAYDTDLHYFDYLKAHPERLPAFLGHMEFKNLGLQWHEDPRIVEGTLGTGVERNEVLLVDVGGNAGHQLTGFQSKYPQMAGRLILQDLPDVIGKLDQSALAKAGIEALGCNFFEPQEVKGAKAYYLKMILHDWPDKECISILQNLRPALKKGHSRILINEIVVPDEGAQWFQTSIDLLMMSVHAAQERREQEWRTLVEKAGGLKVKKIWDVAGAIEKVIEVEAL